MKIILLRHEERYLDIGFYSNLTDKGVINSCLLGNTLNKYDIDIVFSSPFIRTLQTIYPFIMKNNYQKKVNCEYTITEHPDYSKYMSIDDINKKYILKTDADKKVEEAKKSCETHYDRRENRNNIKRENRNEDIYSESQSASEYKNQMDKIYKKQDTKFPLEQPDGYYAGDNLFAKA